MFAAHRLWSRWMESVPGGSAYTTASAGSILSVPLHVGAEWFEVSERSISSSPRRASIVSSVQEALAGTNAAFVPSAVSSDSGCAIDLAMAVGSEFDEAGDMVDASSVPCAIAIDVGDPSKFVGLSRIPTPAAQVRSAMLASEGFVVVHIPHWEWNELESTESQQRYLYHAIQRRLDATRPE